MRDDPPYDIKCDITLKIDGPFPLTSGGKRSRKRKNKRFRKTKRSKSSYRK